MESIQYKELARKRCMYVGMYVCMYDMVESIKYSVKNWFGKGVCIMYVYCIVERRVYTIQYKELARKRCMYV